MNHQHFTSQTAQMWRVLTVLAVIPAAIHVLALALAIIGITLPAHWISEHVFDGRLAVLSLWLCTIGGPLFSIIMGLTLEAWHERTRLIARTSGVFSWTLLILGFFTSLPIPYIIVVEW